MDADLIARMYRRIPGQKDWDLLCKLVVQICSVEAADGVAALSQFRT